MGVSPSSEQLLQPCTFDLHDFHSFTFHISANKFHSLFLKLTYIFWIDLNCKIKKKTKKKHLLLGYIMTATKKKGPKWKNWIHLQPCHIEFCGSMQESQNHHKWFSLLNSLSYLISVPMSLFYKLCILVKLSWIKDKTNVRNL